jgi:hypothetical protein
MASFAKSTVYPLSIAPAMSRQKVDVSTSKLVDACLHACVPEVTPHCKPRLVRISWRSSSSLVTTGRPPVRILWSRGKKRPHDVARAEHVCTYSLLTARGGNTPMRGALAFWTISASDCAKMTTNCSGLTETRGVSVRACWGPRRNRSLERAASRLYIDPCRRARPIEDHLPVHAATGYRNAHTRVEKNRKKSGILGLSTCMNKRPSQRPLRVE